MKQDKYIKQDSVKMKNAAYKHNDDDESKSLIIKSPNYQKNRILTQIRQQLVGLS